MLKKDNMIHWSQAKYARKFVRPRDQFLSQKKQNALLKNYAIAFMIIILFAFVAPPLFGGTLEKLEHQKEETLNYNCNHYGADMNKHFGFEVCKTKRN